MRRRNTRITTCARIGFWKWIFGLFCCLYFWSCGKVGDPQAPFIRIPEAVKDLTATQAGYNIVLTWTNPAHNIDGSAATNLAHVRIRSGGVLLETVEAAPAGKPQSKMIPITRGSDTVQIFDVIVDTDRGKLSNRSNIASILPVEVPGRVADLMATVDQGRITLTWEKPEDRPELADAYMVTRTDLPSQTDTVSDPKYDDARYQSGKTVTYQVTAIREVAGRIVSGLGPASVMVTIVDKKPPQPPAGLDVVASNDGAFVAWDPNSESDLKGYYVFRSDGPTGDFKKVSPGLITPNSFIDPNYKQGMRYAVSAVDNSENESPRSPAFP